MREGAHGCPGEATVLLRGRKEWVVAAAKLDEVTSNEGEGGYSGAAGTSGDRGGEGLGLPRGGKQQSAETRAMQEHASWRKESVPPVCTLEEHKADDSNGAQFA